MTVKPMHLSMESIPAEQMMLVASLAVLMYDYFLTLDSEIERFWKRGLYHQLTWSSFLFFANRYLALLGYMPITLSLFNKMDIKLMKCRYLIGIYNIILIVVLQSIGVCMMLRRICALYGRRTGILAFSVVILICAITIGIVGLLKGPFKDTPIIPFRCDSGFTTHQAHYLAGAFAGELVFDGFIFGMTLYKTLTIPRGSGFGLMAMIIRDGALYFGVTITCYLGNILFLTLAGPVNRSAMMNPTNIISSIMMTRLMLNLRDPKLIGKGEEFKTTTINVHGFNGPTGTGATNGDSRNVLGDERSV